MNLKKQSQFVSGIASATPYAKGNYDKMSLYEARKNKPNPSTLLLFLAHASPRARPDPVEGIGLFVLLSAYRVWIPACAGMTKTNVSIVSV
jgi:hypothetical protein